jgi:uncharacterized membrane protein YphA (DoxX/SURF4 family)
MKPFIPTKIAEIVFAIVLAYFGYLQIKYISALSNRVPAFIPGDGKIWIYVFATLFLLTAIAILTDIKKTVACYVFAAVLIFVAILVNGKTFSVNPAESLRDLAFAMAAIVIGNGGKKS